MSGDGNISRNIRNQDIPECIAYLFRCQHGIPRLNGHTVKNVIAPVSVINGDLKRKCLSGALYHAERCISFRPCAVFIGSEADVVMSRFCFADRQLSGRGGSEIKRIALRIRRNKYNVIAGSQSGNCRSGHFYGIGNRVSIGKIRERRVISGDCDAARGLSFKRG